MGKAGERKEMVEDRSGERVLCEKVVRNFILCSRKSMCEFCGYGGRQVV